MYLDRYANVNFQHDKSVGLKDNWGSGSFAASSIVGAIPSTGPITINGSAHVLSLLSPAEHVYPYKTMTQFHNWLHSFEHGPTHHWMDYGSIRGGVVRGSLHRFEHGHDLVAAIHIAKARRSGRVLS